MRYQFETISRLPAKEQGVVRQLLDAIIVKNQAANALERVATTPSAAKPGIDAA